MDSQDLSSAAENIVWHSHDIVRQDRQTLNGHRACCLWFTGLSGSGKSTLANAVEQKLHRCHQVRTYLLDGDNVRHGLCGDLGFTEYDRVENIRRVGEISRLFVDAGLMTLSAFISPFKRDRDVARRLHQAGDFIEVFVDTSLAECEKRDPKGLYKKARSGEINNFTGIDSPYEQPVRAEIRIDTTASSVDAAAEAVIDYLRRHQYL